MESVQWPHFLPSDSCCWEIFVCGRVIPLASPLQQGRFISPFLWGAWIISLGDCILTSQVPRQLKREYFSLGIFRETAAPTHADNLLYVPEFIPARKWHGYWRCLQEQNNNTAKDSTSSFISSLPWSPSIGWNSTRWGSPFPTHCFTLQERLPLYRELLGHVGT